MQGVVQQRQVAGDRSGLYSWTRLGLKWGWEVRDWRLVVGTGCSALAVASCGAATGAQQAADTSTPAATPIIVSTPAPTPEPTLNPAQKIGQPVTTTTGATVVAEKAAPASSGNEFETPPPGGAFLGVEVKECAGNQTLFVSPSAWSVKLADNTQIDASLAVEMSPAPALNSTNLNPGGCTDGWVYFGLPAGSTPVQINLLKADFYWTF